MLDINAWEAVIILIVAFVVIGPERLPEYAAKLGRLVRRAKAMAEEARGQLRDQMGPEFDEIDWRAYDPRQYDPRRIVRDALADPGPGGPPTAAGARHDDRHQSAPVDPGGVSGSTAGSTGNGASPTGGDAVHPHRYDPQRPTPFDTDAT